MEVVEQGLQGNRGNLSRPHNISSVNVCAIVDPFLFRIVLERVADNDKLSPGTALSLAAIVARLSMGLVTVRKRTGAKNKAHRKIALETPIPIGRLLKCQRRT